MSYQKLSSFYDVLTSDQPYDQWLQVVEHFKPHKTSLSILDLGCGTGTFTSKLTHMAPIVYGMDLSSEMIQYAKQKLTEVHWIQGDMSNFDLNQTFDLITIFCDSLNYLQSEEEVMDTFNHVYHHLNEQGIFIFDVHSSHKMLTQFNDQLYMDDREDLTLIWHTTEGELPLSVWHDLTFFTKTDLGTYERIDESQFQRTLEKAQYESMLKMIGFKNIQSFYDFDINNHDEKGDRLFFVATK